VIVFRGGAATGAARPSVHRRVLGKERKVETQYAAATPPSAGRPSSLSTDRQQHWATRAKEPGRHLPSVPPCLLFVLSENESSQANRLGGSVRSHCGATVPSRPYQGALTISLPRVQGRLKNLVWSTSRTAQWCADFLRAEPCATRMVRPWGSAVRANS
jgi:hypothetical protein